VWQRSCAAATPLTSGANCVVQTRRGAGGWGYLRARRWWSASHIAAPVHHNHHTLLSGHAERRARTRAPARQLGCSWDCLTTASEEGPEACVCLADHGGTACRHGRRRTFARQGDCDTAAAATQRLRGCSSGRGPPSQEQERRRQRLQMQREPSLRSSSIAEGSVAKALSPRSPFAPAWIRSPAKRAWFRCLVAVPVVPVTEARSADSSCHPLARTDPRSSGLEAAQACGVGCGGRLRGGALTTYSAVSDNDI
jgi:hypothetical protein